MPFLAYLLSYVFTSTQSSIMISIVGHNKMIDYIKCSFKCNHKLVGNNFIVKISTKDLDSNIDSIVKPT